MTDGRDTDKPVEGGEAGSGVTPETPAESRNAGDSSLAIGIALGVAIGAAVGAAIDNIAMGVGVGIAVGVAIGIAIQSQRRKP